MSLRKVGRTDFAKGQLHLIHYQNTLWNSLLEFRVKYAAQIIM